MIRPPFGVEEMSTSARRVFLIVCIAVGCVCFVIQAIHSTWTSRWLSEMEHLSEDVDTNGSNLDRLRAAGAERELVLQAEEALRQSFATMRRTWSERQYIPEWLRISTAIGFPAIFLYLAILLKKQWDTRGSSRADAAQRAP